jgi:hypothetical protein
MWGVEATTRNRNDTNSHTRDNQIYTVTADKTFHELPTDPRRPEFIPPPFRPIGEFLYDLIGRADK